MDLSLFAPDIYAELGAVNRKKQMAEALRQKGMEGMDRGLIDAGAFKVAHSPLRAIADFAMIYKGSKEGEELTDKTGDLNKQLAQMIRGQFGSAQQAPMQSQAPQTMSPMAELRPTPYDNLYAQASQQYNVPVDLLKRQGQIESNFNPNAKSPAGALGIAQFMPETAKDLGVDPLNPESAIPGQAKYMRQLLDRYNGDQVKALAAYNAGMGNVDKYGGVPPFEETQNYINKFGLTPQSAAPQSQGNNPMLLKGLTPDQAMLMFSANPQGYLGSVQDQIALDTGSMGKTPIYFKDGENIVIGRFTTNGVVNAQTGQPLSPNAQPYMNPYQANQVNPDVQRQLAGAKEGGKIEGERSTVAKMELPKVTAQANDTLRLLEELKNHPGKRSALGKLDANTPDLLSKTIDFASRLEQIGGKQFLEAFQSLKGAGQITEQEGIKATQAIARIQNRELSPEDFDTALNDLVGVIQSGLQRAQSQAAPSSSGELTYNPQTGRLE